MQNERRSLGREEENVLVFFHHGIPMFFSFLFNRTFLRAEATAAAAECKKAWVSFPSLFTSSHSLTGVYYISLCIFFPVWQAASTSTTKHRLGTVVSKGSQIHSSYGGYLRNETKQASLSRLGLGKQRGRGKFLLAKVQQPSRLEERRRRKKRLEPLNLCLCRIYVQRNGVIFFIPPHSSALCDWDKKATPDCTGGSTHTRPL